MMLLVLLLKLMVSLFRLQLLLGSTQRYTSCFVTACLIRLDACTAAAIVTSMRC